jgi:hypothetical protein
MKKKKILPVIIYAVIGIIILVLLVLSLIPFFPSHPFGRCKNQPVEQTVGGPVTCPLSANFWQYIQDDLR